MPIVPATGWLMTFSTWRALGNTYVVAERAAARLDAEAARVLADGADGVVEVLGVAPPGRDRDLELGRVAREMSGNGTRLRPPGSPRVREDEVDVVVGDGSS